MSKHSQPAITPALLAALFLVMPLTALADDVCNDSRPDMQRFATALEPLVPRLSPQGRFVVQKVENGGILVRIDVTYIVGGQPVFRLSVPAPQDAALAIWPHKSNNAALGVGFAYGAGGRVRCEWAVYPKGGRYIFAQSTATSSPPAPTARAQQPTAAQAPTAAQQPAAGAPAAITAQGIGHIRFDMTVKDASAATKQPFWTKRGEGGPCVMAGMQAYPDLSFTLDNKGRIQGVCTRGNRFATDTGIRVGDPAQKVQQAYQGRLTADGNYLTAPLGSGYQMTFNVYQGRVNEICSGHSSLTDATGC